MYEEFIKESNFRSTPINRTGYFNVVKNFMVLILYKSCNKKSIVKQSYIAFIAKKGNFASS